MLLHVFVKYQANGDELMKSIYEKVLGEEYNKLHPALQKKFGLTSDSKKIAVGTGTMNRIWGGNLLMKPILRLGAIKHLTFPERGDSIPFTLENVAYENERGEECFAWIRQFNFNKPRNFDATMTYNMNKNNITDYLGLHQDFISDISLQVLDNGGIKITSSPIRYKQVTLPKAINGQAEVMEWYDESMGKFHIFVEVKNHYFGTIFGYEGTFSIQYKAINEIPKFVMPRRNAR